MDLFRLVAANINVDPLPHVSADNNRLTSLVSTVTLITASIALLIIVIAGFKYITSRGEGQSIAKAKNTIVYAVVGLVVSMTAYSIVAFVIGKAR